MGRPKGSTNKKTTVAPSVPTANGGKTSSTIASETLGVEKRLPETPDAQLQSEIQEANEGEAKVAALSKVDALTEFLRAFFEMPSLGFIADYADNRLPHLKTGQILKVARCYKPVNFIVDSFPKDTKQDDIDAKKWEFQRLGYKYSWILVGEELDLNPKDGKNELMKRAEPLKPTQENPKVPAKRLLFMTNNVLGDVNTIMAGER